MEASGDEISLSRTACLIDELDGKPFNAGHWRGYHPRVYNKPGSHEARSLVPQLCERLQGLDVTQYSLEMQIWWRDHLAADKARVEVYVAAATTEAEKHAALAKLDAHERKILGLD